MTRALSEGHEDDGARLERLRAAMQSGAIKPNATAIAKGLLKEQGHESEDGAGSN